MEVTEVKGRMREEGGREGGKRKEGGRAKKYKRTMKIEK